jgi:hypothetical protein
VARGGLQPPRFTCRVALHIHDPMSCLGNYLPGRSLEGLEATKGIGAGRRWAPMALISGPEPHDHPPCVRVIRFKVSQVDPLCGEAS